MRRIILILLVLATGYITFEIYNLSLKRTSVLKDYTEVRHIKYGLLSVHTWKTQISEILAKKVREFQLSDENRIELRQSIQSGLYQLLDEIDRVVEANRQNQGFLEQLATSFIQSIFFSINDLRAKIPEFTEIILSELDNYDTREKLREFIMAKVDALLYETIGKEDLSKLEEIYANRDCNNINTCGSTLESELEDIDSQLKILGLVVLVLTILTYLIGFVGQKSFEKSLYVLSFLVCIVLLFGGVTTAMIDIDARIDSFSFLLMGEPLEFKDQILFHQSKSIYEVVTILLKNVDYQSILVGCLIFLFSVIFPISKIISSFMILNKADMSKNDILNFLAFKSGKWSMADVTVVAIFMAFIGFKGVIGNQLTQLQNLSDKVDILTTDKSTFGIGFIMFLCFCLLSLILSYKLESKIR